mgnify:CR=1 FL=1
MHGCESAVGAGREEEKLRRGGARTCRWTSRTRAVSGRRHRREEDGALPRTGGELSGKGGGKRPRGGAEAEPKQVGGFTPPMPRVSTQARDARTAQGWRTEEETAARGRGLVSDLVLAQREVMRLRVVVQAQERFNRRLESQHQADVRRVREVKALGRKIQGKLQAAARQVRSERAAWRLEEGEQRRQLDAEWRQVTRAVQAAGMAGRGQEQVGVEAPKRDLRNSAEQKKFKRRGG